MPEDPFVPCSSCNTQIDKAAHEVTLDDVEQQHPLPLHAYQCPACGARTRVAIEGRRGRAGGFSERESDG